MLPADKTALPALAEILEVKTRPVRVFTEAYRVDLDVEWVFRDSAVLKAIQGNALSTVTWHECAASPR